MRRNPAGPKPLYWLLLVLAAVSNRGDGQEVATNVPPANDNFTNATVVSGDFFIINETNINATAEPGEPSHDGTGPVHSVWLHWPAPTNGIVDLSVGYPILPITILTNGSAAQLGATDSIGAI